MNQNKLTETSYRIYLNVFAAMQEAEEIGGPEVQDYIALMEQIKAEADERIANAKMLEE
jgi:hypothetical protein